MLDFSDINGEANCKLEHVFFIASLQELCIRHMSFSNEAWVNLAHSPWLAGIALQKLTLEDMHLPPELIYSILCLPESLTHLTLRYTASLGYHLMERDVLISSSANNYMMALGRQKHSLQFLHLNEALSACIDRGTFDFRDFPELRTLELWNSPTVPLMHGKHTMWSISRRL
jgi:hypothetical protein